jgi:tetratricopeptide (TPR) repeat protein
MMTSLNNLAAIEMRLDRLESARMHYRESLQKARALFGAQNREVALPLMGLGMVERALGDTESALQHLREAAAIYTRWQGEEHPDSAYAHVLLGETLLLAGESLEARAAIVGTAASLEQAFGADSIKATRARFVTTLANGPQHAPASGDDLLRLSRDDAPAHLRLWSRWLQASEAQRLQVAAEAASLKPRDALLRRHLEEGPALTPLR